jgi:hypothetical protein
MEPCYAVLVFVCCMQPALLLLSMSLQDEHMSRNVWEVLPWRYNGTNTSVIARQEPLNLDSTIWACSAGACVFGVLYTMVMRSQDEGAFTHALDEHSVEDMVEKGGDAGSVRALESGRLLFWLFVSVHAYGVSTWLSPTSDMQHLHVEMMGRCAGLWTLCRTGHSRRGRFPMLLGALAYGYWWCTMLDGSRRMVMQAVLALQYAWDAVLVYGHQGDALARAIVVLNCRLFYVAASCSTWILMLRLATAGGL